MDDEQTAVNPSGEENIATEAPTVEENALETTVSEESAETTEQSSEEAGDEGEKKFNGAEKRIHNLVGKVKEKDEIIQDLSSKIAELTGSARAEQEGYPQNMPQDGEERVLTVDDLRTIARLEAQKERMLARIDSEAVEAQKAHPELDPDGAHFDPDINEAVTTAVWLEVQRDPTQSVTKLTEKYMKPYRKAAERAVGQEKAELARQVNDAALRPQAIKSVDKQFQDKSIDEMEAELGLVY
jgi:hypothetical protein